MYLGHQTIVKVMSFQGIQAEWRAEQNSSWEQTQWSPPDTNNNNIKYVY